MPIEQFNVKCDQILLNLEIAFNEKFKSIADHEDNHNELGRKFENMRDRLIQLENLVYEASEDLAGVKYTIKKLNAPVRPMKISEVVKKTAEFNAKKEQDNLRMESLKQEFDFYVKQIADQRIELALYELNKEKFQRAQKKLDFFENCSKMVSATLTSAEILWIFMQLDIEKIQNKFDNTEELAEENTKCLKRIEALEAIRRNKIEEEVINEFVQDFGTILSSLSMNSTLKSQSMSLKSCIQQFSSYEKGISKRIESECRWNDGHAVSSRKTFGVKQKS